MASLVAASVWFNPSQKLMQDQHKELGQRTDDASVNLASVPKALSTEFNQKS